MKSSIVIELQRSIFARIPAQVIQTTDVAQAQEDVINFLDSNEHIYTTWSPIKGKRTLEVIGETELSLSDADTSYAGEIQRVLIDWIARHADQKVYKADGEDGPTYKSEASDVAFTYLDSDKLLHNTLVLVGAEIYLDKTSHHYDPIAAHAVWEVMQGNLRDLTNLIIIVPTGTSLPEKIVSASSLIEDDLPTREEFFDVIWPAFVQGCPPSLLQPIGDLDDIAPLVVDRLCGLTRPVARNTLTRAIIHTAHHPSGGSVDAASFFLSKLAESKEKELKKSSALEIMKATPMEKIGGLDRYKSWITPRKVAFSEEARSLGIPRPKGVLLVGPPGTGKTEVAKATASTLGVPLIRADLGAVYGGIVGASEANMRTMLKTLEAAAPCVVLFDEIEKALGGTSGPSTDSGTSQRVFGTLLSWMQDREQDNMIFIVATANDVSSLPPEFLRKGRFDELFFVDLPNSEERSAIFDIHLEPVADQFDYTFLTSLLDMTEGFVGAEIAQAVVEARISYFAASSQLGKQGVGPEAFSAYLMQAISDTRPLSVTMKEKISAVRNWAEDRARPASSKEVATQPRTRRPGGISFTGIG